MSKLDYTNDYNFSRLSRNGETSWEDILDRFINELIKRGTKIPKGDLEWILKNYYFLPNSPSLLTAGNDKFYSSACSSYIPEDTMFNDDFSIMEILNIANKATVAGIGCGYTFSKLRSKDEPVRGRIGLTGGPVSFMKSYDGFLKNITQATRKSANMGVLHVNHPDIVDFINAKNTDGELSCFNISVLLDDEFMEAAINKKTYTQRYISTKETKEVDADDLLNLMAEKAWSSGEPGFLFIDNIKRDYFEDLDDNEFCWNPCCFAGYNQLLTKNGYKRFDELAKLESVEIVGGDGKVHKSKVWSAGIKNTIILKFENILEEECFTVTSREKFDKYIECTPEHIFEHEGKEVQAKDLLGLTFMHKHFYTSNLDGVVMRKEINIPYKCTSIENGHKIEVYDFEEPNTHWGYVEGFKVHNSEAILTSRNKKDDTYLEMCVLGSLNLSKFYYLTKEEKKRVIKIAVDILNCIIDTQDYVSEYQRIGMQQRNRKIGIGVCGLATVFAKEGIKYSSEEAYNLTYLIFKEIGDFAIERSEELYEENKNNLNLLHSSPLHKLKRYNASLISIAPTSTLSQIFDQMTDTGTSWGCEPYFEITPYTINNSYGKFEKKEKIVDVLGGLDKAKEIIECANDLDYLSHLKPVKAILDANFGRMCNQSVSKTLNFKNNITVEDIKKSIIYCWKNGIKGISMYRDGSRKNQVISTKDSYKDCVELDAKGRPTDLFCHQSPKRPEILEADIFRLTKDKQNWLVLVGLYKNKPYEIFAGLEEAVSIPKKYKTGKIQKNGGYNLILGEGDDELKIKDIPNAFKNPQFASLTRLISFSLRHGGPVKFLTEQLLKEGGFDSFNKAIARVLKKYINDDEGLEKPCPNCGGKMVYISGCPVCVGSTDLITGGVIPGCGYTKCG